MAVAQAQHRVRELYDALTKRGVDVKFAIHPVAGRMPGHMNVLLAEADIPYDKLIEMDEINPELPQTRRGAGDRRQRRGQPRRPARQVAARSTACRSSTPTRPRTVFVIKRSMNPGFAGIENELFYADKTLMLFGDAKAVVGDLVKELASGSGLH